MLSSISKIGISPSFKANPNNNDGNNNANNANRRPVVRQIYHPVSPASQSNFVPTQQFLASRQTKVSALERGLNGAGNFVAGTVDAVDSYFKARRARSNDIAAQQDYKVGLIVSEFEDCKESMDITADGFNKYYFDSIHDYQNQKMLLETAIPDQGIANGDYNAWLGRTLLQHDNMDGSKTWYYRSKFPSTISNIPYERTLVKCYGQVFSGTLEHPRACAAFMDFQKSLTIDGMTYDTLNKVQHIDNACVFGVPTNKQVLANATRSSQSPEYALSALAGFLQGPVVFSNAKYYPNDNTLEAETLVTYKRDPHTKEVLSSKLYYNPVIEFYLDEKNRPNCRITASCTYERSESEKEKGTFRDKVKFSKGIDETYTLFDNGKRIGNDIFAESHLILDTARMQENLLVGTCYENLRKGTEVHTSYDFKRECNEISVANLNDQLISSHIERFKGEE